MEAELQQTKRMQRNSTCLYRLHISTLLEVSTSRPIIGAKENSEGREAIAKNKSYSPEH